MKNKYSKQKAGIKGWLLIYLIITSMVFLIGVWDLCVKLYILSEFDVIHSGFIDTTMTYILVGIVSVLSIIFLCLKKPFTPLFIVIIEAFKIGLLANEFVLSEKSLYDWSSVLFSTILGLFWMIYFMRSSRVKNTFQSN